MAKKDSFQDARQDLRRAAIRYVTAINGSLQLGTMTAKDIMRDAEQLLMDAAIDFATVAQLKLDAEDRKRKESLQ